LFFKDRRRQGREGGRTIQHIETCKKGLEKGKGAGKREKCVKTRMVARL
jgi:hypothetical protein